MNKKCFIIISVVLCFIFLFYFGFNLVDIIKGWQNFNDLPDDYKKSETGKVALNALIKSTTDFGIISIFFLLFLLGIYLLYKILRKCYYFDKEIGSLNWEIKIVKNKGEKYEEK